MTATGSADVRVAARHFVGTGLDIVPVNSRSKRITVKDWETRSFNADDFGPDNNIGLRLGKDGLADVDLDCKEACLVASLFLPETGFVFGRKSARASHWFYRVDPPRSSLKLVDPILGKQKGSTLVEFRCLKKDGTVGHQTVAPGSIHEDTGEAIEFEPGSNQLIANVDAALVVQAVHRIAATALLARHFPPAKSGRNDTFLAIAGALARAGWNHEDAETFNWAIYRILWGGAASRSSNASEVQASFEKFHGGCKVLGIPELKRHIDSRAVDAALAWIDIGEARGGLDGAAVRSTQGETPDWPKLEPIQSDLPPVQSFSEDLLPDSFRPLVKDVTERMQVPMDYPAVVIVLCLAGVVNRRACIQPKANDTGWQITPNLWGGIIAPPGFMKSPVIQAATRPLNQIQGEWRQEYEEALKDFAREKEEYELRCAAWREQFKTSAKKGSAAPSRPGDEPEAQKLRRLIVNDATFEALHQTMNENPAGILVIRDELTGWWSQLDKPGREGERAFCLQAWNGDTGHTIDRIGRGTIHVEACCMSLLGGIQPGRLRSYLVDALEDGPSNDGLIQRFQLMAWPDTDREWTYVDRAPHAASEEMAARVFRKLVELDPENPMRYHFSPEAQALFIEWLAELEAKIRGDELHPALISHLSKYRSLMPALATLFELAEWAAGKGSADTVSIKHTQQAAAWCEYLESHSRRVYSCVVTPQLRAARELAAKLRSRKVAAGGSFSCREVYLKGWSCLDTTEAVKQAADVLQDAGWVREIPGAESVPTGGRPSNRYEVNPEVWK